MFADKDVKISENPPHPSGWTVGDRVYPRSISNLSKARKLNWNLLKQVSNSFFNFPDARTCSGNFPNKLGRPTKLQSIF